MASPSSLLFFHQMLFAARCLLFASILSGGPPFATFDASNYPLESQTPLVTYSTFVYTTASTCSPQCPTSTIIQLSGDVSNPFIGWLNHKLSLTSMLQTVSGTSNKQTFLPGYEKSVIQMQATSSPKEMKIPASAQTSKTKSTCGNSRAMVVTKITTRGDTVSTATPSFLIWGFRGSLAVLVIPYRLGVATSSLRCKPLIPGGEALLASA
ncbi:hypothetical protein EDB87DRAFT_1767539 [Lactarius vividus]|nr:hypothetical protein EDB87DRAFT_1767539 [Lactarius vividus]